MLFSSNDNFQIFYIVFGLLLLLKPNHFTLGDEVNINNYTTSMIQKPASYRNMSMKTIRFRGSDFEPRTVGASVNERIDATSSIYNDGDGDGETSNSGARKSRGLHFKADNHDLAVDLEFIVPFIRIPIGRSVDVTKSALRNLVNLNSGTLLLSGAFIAVGAAVAGVVKALSAPTLAYGGNYGYGYKKKLRSAETFGNVMDAFNIVSYGQQTNGSAPGKSVTKVYEFISRIEAKLLENDIDMSACIQKTICGHVKKAVSGVRIGKGSPMEKIIDGFANLDMLQQFLNGTAVQNAIDTGNSKDSHSCDYIYRSCKWMQPEHKLMQTMLKYFRLLYVP